MLTRNVDGSHGFGECKWWDAPVGENVLDHLIEKSKKVKSRWKRQKRYLLFSASGFTDQLFQRAAAEGVVLIEANGIGFVSVLEPFDTTSAIGKACLGMIGVFAQLERDLIAERTKDALRYLKEIGEPLGTPALGFAVGNNGREPVDSELAVVRYAKKLRRSGYGLGKIASTLNLEGIATKRGGKWHKSTVRYLLNNSLYDGIE